MADVQKQERLSSTPAGIKLCLLGEIPENKARGFVLQMRTGRFHGFVVRRSDEAFGYVDSCPHVGLPLAKTLDDYVAPNGMYIVCGWHGAMFNFDDGLCVGGPCSGQSLIPWPVKVEDGWLVTSLTPLSKENQT